MRSESLPLNSKYGSKDSSSSPSWPRPSSKGPRAESTISNGFTQSLSFQAGSLLSAYTLYGYFQEKIVTAKYDSTQPPSSVLLVACNRLFSILVAISRHPRRRLQKDQTTSQWHSLRPLHPIYSYASVSLFNFLSTLCQYEALKHVNFTTQTLGKCSKMVPVLLVGAVVYRRRYTWENVMAVGLVTVGTAMYMLTTPIQSNSNVELSTARGLCLLIGYLLFDALASTTEERLFKRSKGSSGLNARSVMCLTDPIASKEAAEDKSERVYDQMLWINVCSLGVSIFVLATDKNNSLYSLVDLMRSPSRLRFRLLADMIALSASSSIGLIFLLTVIANFGALTSSAIMTGRQFLSIVLNGIAFGSLWKVGFWGWVGIGYVASGVWMEVMRKRRVHKEKLEDGVVIKHHQERTRLLCHLGVPLMSGIIGRIGILILTALSPSWTDNTVARLNDAPIISVAYPDLSYSNINYGVEQLAEIKSLTICPEPAERGFYSLPIPRTALASFPRSGNTFVRELVEHSTGYYTVDVKCRKSPAKFYFSAACDHPENNFLVKTHTPEMSMYGEPEESWAGQVEQFGRALHVVRNPLDAMWSWWHLLRNPYDHEYRKPGVDQLGDDDVEELEKMARSWVWHTDYWIRAHDKSKLVVRYEDLRGGNQTQHLANILSFLLPQDQLPPIERVICADDDRAIAYNSRKAAPFYSWEHFTDDTRKRLLLIVKERWCQLGYEDMLREQRGIVGVNCD